MISAFQRRALALLAAAMPFVVILSPACRSIVGIPGGDIIIAGTGGSGGGQGGHGGAGKGGEDAGSGVSCEEYCATVQAGCTGANAVYFSLEACNSLCPFMTLGAADDQMKNTVGCRLDLANLAKVANDVEGCKGAGPAGNDLCGSNCESYCALLGAICPNELTNHFGGAQQCLMDCMNIPDTKTYTSTETLPSDDSIQCRIRHLNSAAIGAAATHCMHAIGVGQCPLVTDGGTGDAGDGG